MEKIYDLAVIGAGPTGIGVAIEARVRGLKDIVLFEKGDNHSQTIRTFYKDNKRVDRDYKGQVVELDGNIEFTDGTKESTLDYFDLLLRNNSVNVINNTEVESIQKKDDIFEVVTSSNSYKTKYVVIAIGKMGKPNKPSYKIPIEIRDLVNFNLDKCTKGEKILIVGGGNSAAEYAVDLSATNDVTLNYRRATFSRLNDINEKNLYELEKNKKLQLKLGIDVIELQEENKKVKVIFADQSSITYDRVVYAIGGTTPVDFLKKCGIELEGDENKIKPIHDENLQSNVGGLFVAGDIACASGGSIALGLNHAHKIIDFIIEKSNK